MTNAETRAEPGRQFGWRDATPLILVIGLSVALRALIASVPLERDEGEYAYIADRWLAGDVPYRDAFDQKPPGIFLVYAAWFVLGGKSSAAIHWLGHLSLLGTLAFVYLIGRRLFSHAVGWLATLAATALLMDESVLGSSSNTEMFAILPLTAGMYVALVAGEQAGRSRCVAVGLLGGLALCFKQVALPVVIFLAVWILVSQRRSVRVSSWVGSIGAWFAGLGLVLLPTCLYFVVRGAWAPFWDCVIAHNLGYSSQVSLTEYGPRLWLALVPILNAQWPLLLGAAAGTADAYLRGTRELRPCLWWWLCSLLALSVGGYFREHYFVLLMPPTALVSAYGLWAIAQRLEARRTAWQEPIAAVFAIAAVAWPVYQGRDYYFAASGDAVSRELYGMNPFPESRPMGRVIAERSAPGDTLFVYGSEPQLLFYSRLKSASRYIYMYPLYEPGPDTLDRQRSVLRELAERPPRFVVTVPIPTSFGPWAHRAPRDLRERLFAILAKEYKPVAATIARQDGTSRLLRLEDQPDNEAGTFEIGQNELPTMEFWERRDAAGYTEP